MSAVSEPQSLDERTPLLTQLYIAEYQALTTRNTTWGTLQFSLMPVLLLFFAIVSAVWNSLDRGLLLWASVTAIQIVVLAGYQTGWESYNNTRYLEKSLRPKVTRLLNDDNIWKYESYLREQRADAFLWWEYYGAVACLAAFLVVVCLRLALWRAVDYWGLSLNILLLAVITHMSIRLVRTRRDFFPAF